jgi:plasmid stabilization system protein ParE
MSYASWTEPAAKDISAIYEFIARRDRRLSVAKKVVRKLRDHCEDYGKLTSSGNTLGTSREDLGDGIRIFAHQRWVVVFRPREHGIEVLRIFDSSRDFANLFRNEFET